MLARVIEGQGVEMVEKVHILHMHMVRGLDARRGEIEDGGDARIHQVLGRTLGAFGRLAAGTAAGLVVYLALCLALRVDTLKELLGGVLGRLRRG